MGTCISGYLWNQHFPPLKIPAFLNSQELFNPGLSQVSIANYTWYVERETLNIKEIGGVRRMVSQVAKLAV